MERTVPEKVRREGAAVRAQDSGDTPLQNILAGAPSWLGSAIIHALLILLLCQITWATGEREKKNIVVSLPQTIREDDKKQSEVQRPDMKPLETPLPNPQMKGIASDPELGDESDIEEPDLPILTNTLEPRNAREVVVMVLPGNISTGDLSDIFRNRPGGRGGKGDDDGTSWAPPTGPGMNWLARVQEPDGHWDSMKWGANHNCDAGVTGLALLAFLGNGQTDRAGRYRATVRKALLWLSKRQTSDGGFGERFYTQGICTMAVSEAYAMTSSPQWRAMAQKAVDYCCANQNPNGGWDYNGNNPNRVDTSVTGWVVMALKSARAARLHVPDSATERIKQWLRESINADGTTGYTNRIGARGSSGGTPPMTAVATLCRIFVPESARRGDIGEALAYLSKRGVDLNNLYYTYYGTFAMHQARRVYPKYWNKWNKAFRKALIARQIKDRKSELHGSWNTDFTYGSHGGRVYTTALSVMCLEVDYILLPILKRTDI